MRPILKTITIVTVTSVVSLSQAAPMSMLQTVPREGSATASQPAPPRAPSKMGWLTKWMGNKPNDVVTPALQATSTPQLVGQSTPQATQIEPGQTEFPQLAYLPPEASSRPVSNAIPNIAIQNNAVPTLAAQTPIVSNPTQTANARSLREQGHEADRQGALGEAERLYRLAMEADPTSAAAVNDLALCLARQGELDTSAATFQQAISMRPEKPLYRNNIATVLVEMGLYEDAKSHLMAAYPPATASYNLGHLLVNRGKQQEAINAFQEALAHDPNLAPAHQMLASLAPTTNAPAEINSTPHVAQAPTTISSAPTNAPALQNTPEQLPTSATPSFPRLLPPVINR